MLKSKLPISRRNALKSFGAAAAVPVLGIDPGSAARESAAATADLDAAALAAIAEVVLPAEADRRAAVAAFRRWIRDYKEGADTDHGYGNTRVRATGPSPARNYPPQIAALDEAARAAGARSFAAAPLARRRSLIEAALAGAGVERLPARPSGAHIASDLMGHFFNSAAANDLCYKAAIGRDTCRGLPGSEKRPAARPSRRVRP